MIVFASPPSKRDDAIAFGANKFHVTREPLTQNLVAPVQHPFRCRDAAPDVLKVLPQVAYGSMIYILSASPEAVPVPIQTLVGNGVRIQGTDDASQKNVRWML